MDVKDREVILSDDVSPVMESKREIPQDREVIASSNVVNPSSSDCEDIVPTTRRDLRALAYLYLYALDRFDYTVSLQAIIDNFSRGFGVVVAKDSYAITLASNVNDLQGDLDLELLPLLKNWKLERISCTTLIILRIALWELKQPGAVPSIVINEAIELAKGYAEKDSYRFVNGILDEAVKVQTKKQDVA